MNTLWIAVHLPDLALQSATRGLLPQLPVVITETTGNRTLVHQANAPAQGAGIRANMTAAAARAYAAELVLLPRDVAKEAASLEKIALCALRYTPGASIVRASVVLDVTASLTLFGGLGKLCGLLRQDLRELGYHAALGVAPTPLAAELLALASADGFEARACTSFEQLPERLRPIPASLLPWDDATRATLATLGLRTLGQLYDAPRDGFLRRFGFACSEDLDRIAGALPDPRAPLLVPDRFQSTYDFAAEIDDLAIHLRAIERLLVEAKGFLAARGAATTAIALTLRHGRQFTTKHAVASSLPQRDVQQWVLLVREQLQRTPLPGPVTAIHLAIDELAEYVPPPNGLPGWLPDSRAQAEDRLRLLDRLAARLGKERVFTLATRAEHRPEAAWTSDSAGRKDDGNRKGAPNSGIRSAPRRSGNGTKNAPLASRPHAALNARPRPAWLLDRPRALVTRDGDPLHHGPLTMIAGPERIQSGWWDNKPVDRDYFVARNPLGETCWVYRELDASCRWYLHGVFG
jgi:protein ImuB